MDYPKHFRTRHRKIHFQSEIILRKTLKLEILLRERLVDVATSSRQLLCKCRHHKDIQTTEEALSYAPLPCVFLFPLAPDLVNSSSMLLGSAFSKSPPQAPCAVPVAGSFCHSLCVQQEELEFWRDSEFRAHTEDVIRVVGKKCGRNLVRCHICEMCMATSKA